MKNPLEAEIEELSLFFQGGGLYVLKDVKYAANVIIDIWMLIDRVKDPEDLKLLREYNGLPYRER